MVKLKSVTLLHISFLCKISYYFIFTNLTHAELRAQQKLEAANACHFDGRPQVFAALEFLPETKLAPNPAIYKTYTIRKVN